MASVNFEKLKSPQEVKAMLRHCDINERMKHNHSNEHIDKSLTHTNLQSNITYEQACERFDKRIEYLDSLDGANKRSDRVLCFGLTIPCPKGLTEQQEVKFFCETVRLVGAQCGVDNIVCAYFHRDEKHKYIDAETHKERESDNHGHMYVVPGIAEKLNGKEFSSKKNMLKLNKAIHKMCQEQFGIDFMDGSKKKSKKSVETLKNQSREIELQEEVVKKLQNEREILLQDISDINEFMEFKRKKIEERIEQGKEKNKEDIHKAYENALNEYNSQQENEKQFLGLFQIDLKDENEETKKFAKGIRRFSHLAMANALETYKNISEMHENENVVSQPYENEKSLKNDSRHIFDILKEKRDKSDAENERYGDLIQRTR